MARKKQSEEIVEVVTLGDKSYNENDLTPSEYFDYVKGLKQKLNYDDYNIIIDNGLTMLKKTKITGQTSMAKEITHQIELALKELDAARDGFDIFIDKKDIERYIEKVEDKVVKIIEISEYEREIPDDIIDKIELARKHFDELYIVFTDYTLKETKKVAKERRDKDPILFGAFHDREEKDKGNIYVEDRMFFIADWKEEKCDLTLEEIVRDIKDKEGKDITYKVSVPKNEEEVKAMLKSYNNPIEDMKPVSLFDKIKNKLSKSKEDKKTPSRRKRGALVKE